MSQLFLHTKFSILVIADFLCDEMEVPRNNALFCSIIYWMLWFTGKNKKKGVNFLNGDGITNGKY